jgi:hypothetical protein
MIKRNKPRLKVANRSTPPSAAKGEAFTSATNQQREQKNGICLTTRFISKSVSYRITESNWQAFKEQGVPRVLGLPELSLPPVRVKEVLRLLTK